MFSQKTRPTKHAFDLIQPFPRLARRWAALFLCFCLLPVQGVYAESRPSFVSSAAVQTEVSISQGPSIAIPKEMGSVDEYHQGSNGKTIVYIQDAHDSLEAQENIAKIITYLVKNSGVKTVLEEGYEGPVPSDAFFSVFKDPKAKEKVSYFLMDKLRLGGAEYAHVNRTQDFDLIGIDSIALHKKNIAWYQKSTAERAFIAKDLEAIYTEIKILENQYFPKELKAWVRLKDRLDRGHISLLDYLKRLDKKNMKNYPSMDVLLRAESSEDETIAREAQSLDARTLFEEIDHFENDYADGYLTNPRDRKIYRIHKALNLLKRLNQIEVTPDEFELAQKALKVLRTKTMAQFLNETTGKPVILSNLWEELLQNAVHFYETAETRDGLLMKGLRSASKNEDYSPEVLVFGGFHKNRIKSILNQQNYSYLIVSPKISAVSPVHQRYYKQLMSGGYHRFEMPFLVSRAAPAERVMEMFGQNVGRFLDYLSGAEIARDEAVQSALAARSEIRSREDVASRLKAMSASGIKDWTELLVLMKKFPKFFDRIYLDLDETVFTSKVYRGSHQWYVDEARYFESGKWRLGAKKGRIEKELLKQGLIRLVEPHLIEVLQEMKRVNPNLVIQGLTSRRDFLTETTEQILNSLGLGDLQVQYGAYKGAKLQFIHRELSEDPRPDRGITLFIDDDAETFAKHPLLGKLDAMGTVIMPNKRVSHFDFETRLSLFRESAAQGKAPDGAPQKGDYLTDALLLSRFSEAARERAGFYLDEEVRQFVLAGSDVVKMAYIEAVTDFFSRSFEKPLPKAEQDALLDFYYGLVSYDKDLWKEAHLEGKLTYQKIDPRYPFLQGRGNYEILLTPENAYFFMEPLLDYLSAEKPDVVLLPDTAARPFTESLRYFIEQEGLSTRVINFPISTGDARDTRYELTRWMRLLRGELPPADESDEKLIAFLRESGINEIHSNDKVVIFDDGITRGHAVTMITSVVEEIFNASVRGAFVAFDYRKNIDKRRFAAVSAFRVYGEFGAKDTHYASAPGVIVRMAWEFDPEFKGVGSRNPYYPPPPKFKGAGGGGQVLAGFKRDYERFFHRSQRAHILPERRDEARLAVNRPVIKANADDTIHLPNEIRGFVGDSRAAGGLTREQLLQKLESLSTDRQGGELVKLLRKQAGLVQNKLGTLSDVSLVERGKRSINDRILARILEGLILGYNEDPRLSAEEVEFYVRKGFGRLTSEHEALLLNSQEAGGGTRHDSEDSLRLVRVRDEIPDWVSEDKAITPRIRRLLGEKNVFFYRLVHRGEDLGYVVLAVLKNRAGEDSLVIEKIQPRMVHDQDVDPQAVRDVIVRYLSEDNKTLHALYTDTRVAIMAGVSESHRVRRGLSTGYFRQMPQTMDLWHEGTADYYKDHLAGTLGLVWRRFDSEGQKRFDLASQYLEVILTERNWGAGLIKSAFDTDIKRYTAQRRMHLPFDQADVLSLQEIVRMLEELQGQMSDHAFGNTRVEEEAKFKLKARVEMLKYERLGIKPDFKQFYTQGGKREQRKLRQDLALRFFLRHFWKGSYDLAGMNWVEIQKRFSDWGAEDLLEKVSGKKKGGLLDHVVPGGFKRQGRYFKLKDGYHLSKETFQRYLDGDWYAVPAGSEYVIQGDEAIPSHWTVSNDFFNLRQGVKVRFESVEDAGVVGRETAAASVTSGVFFFREGKTYYEARSVNRVFPEEYGTATRNLPQAERKIKALDLKLRVLRQAEELMGRNVAFRIVHQINDAIERHPLFHSNPEKVFSDFEIFLDEASYLSKTLEIQLYFSSLIERSDGTFGHFELRTSKFAIKGSPAVNRLNIQNLQGKYTVPVDMTTFEALEPEQQEEFYKLIEIYSDNDRVNFIFILDVRHDRIMTAALRTVNDLADKHRNVRVKVLTNVNIDWPVLESRDVLGRKVIGIMREGSEALPAERLREEVDDPQSLFLLKYLQEIKEPGLLLAAIKLLDSGQDEVLRLNEFFTANDVPFSLRSEMRSILMTYEAVVSSA